METKTTVVFFIIMALVFGLCYWLVESYSFGLLLAGLLALTLGGSGFYLYQKYK